MLFDIFNIFPCYLNVNYWTGKSVHIFSWKQVISGNFRRYDVYSWVWDCHPYIFYIVRIGIFSQNLGARPNI